MLLKLDHKLNDQLVSIHAPRCRGAMLISRNYRKQGHKTAALRERPEPGARAILHEMLDRKKRE